LGLFLFIALSIYPLINSPFIGALLFYIGLNLSPILTPINNYFFLWYTYLLTLYFIALNGLKIAHLFGGGKYTTRPLRFALHRFALRPHMVESVFEDTRTHRGLVKDTANLQPVLQWFIWQGTASS
jgi:hypothetical protein